MFLLMCDKAFFDCKGNDIFRLNDSPSHLGLFNSQAFANHIE